MHFGMRLWSGMVACACLAPAWAGIINPDVSAIGQVRAGLTDDAANPDAGDPTLSLGESEVILDAWLNPYFKGWFTFAAGDEGVELEEVYTSLVKGLPWGLAMKAGKYRLGFGRLNPIHPHAYPFLEPPRSLVSLLPGGEEGFNETGLQVSALLPTPGNWASILSADVLQGSQFHPEEEDTRLGGLGRWSNGFLLGEKGALDVGISGATGTDQVEGDTRAYLAGADAKARFYFPRASQLTLQGEGVFRHSHDGMDTVNQSFPSEDRFGFYAFADYRYHAQYNGGVLFEQWQRQGDPDLYDRAVKMFAGYAVLEESTLLRVGYEYFMPDGEAVVNTVSVQLLYSMGPHKPHQF